MSNTAAVCPPSQEKHSSCCGLQAGVTAEANLVREHVAPEVGSNRGETMRYRMYQHDSIACPSPLVLSLTSMEDDESLKKCVGVDGETHKKIFSCS